MNINLFDFDFTDSYEEKFKEKNIVKQFNELKTIFKEKMNPYYMDLESIPREMNFYLDEFLKRGWIEKRGNGFSLLDEYIDYHTVEEVISSYKKALSKVLKKEDVCWYNDILPVVNFASSPIRYKNEKERKMIYKEKEKVIKDVALSLGLEHFINKPSARGPKLTAFGSKWSREYVLPMVAEQIIPITDYDEMKAFFYNHVFFFGRRDWENENTAPYAVFKSLMPSYLELASLCEANDLKTVQLIFEYVGFVTGIAKGKIVLYPSGWSMERYEKTLTTDDKILIQQDQERLKRLHEKI